MILTTANEVPGHEISAVLDIVKGNAIRGSHLGADITAFLKNLVGGEIEEYTKTMAEAREQALDRMLDEARRTGADAVVGVRFSTSFIASGTAEFLVYGTAVRFTDRPGTGAA
jgi:uncharacterized protein YbjQ (UPF0145 family)